MKQDQLRPTRLIEYIGQDQIKDQLGAALASAKARDTALPHVLLSGPPGLGKTTLAMIIANEMGWTMIDLIGSTAGNPTALTKKIMRIKPETMFFIDEIHALRKPVQEILYPVLEDNRVLFRIGSASAEVDLPPVTIMGATTDLGKLTQPFIDRFQLQFELSFYHVDELIELGVISSGKLGLNLPEEAIEVIAERSRGTPRYVNNYLKWVRDFKIFEKVETVDRKFVQHVMRRKLRIDNLGLRPLDRNYLRTLADSPTPVGVEAIGSKLRQAVVTLENTVEPFLLYAGLAVRIRNGRAITEAGRAHLDSLHRSSSRNPSRA